MRRHWLIQPDRRRAVVATVLAMVAVVGTVATIVAEIMDAAQVPHKHAAGCSCGCHGAHRH